MPNMEKKKRDKIVVLNLLSEYKKKLMDRPTTYLTVPVDSLFRIRNGILNDPGFPRLPYILRKIITDHTHNPNVCDQELLVTISVYLKYLYPDGFELCDTKDRVEDIYGEAKNVEDVYD